MKHANSNILFFLKPKVEIAYIYDYHTVRQALEIMEYHKYSSIPILSRDGKYVGSITEGDLLWGLKKLDLFNLKEAEIITRKDIIGYCYNELRKQEEQCGD